VSETKKYEIERKFLIRTIPFTLIDYIPIFIKQGYIFVSESEEIRIRSFNKVYLMTIKIGKGLKRHEFEVAINKDQYSSLWTLTKGKRIYKSRYELKVNECRIFIDVFKKNLKKTTIVEVEFDNIKKAREFQPPDWFGKEITDSPGYYNKNLAVNGDPEAQSTEKSGNVKLPKWLFKQSGVVPYRVNGDLPEIMLVTTRKKKKWTIPKGIIDEHLSAEESALREAEEEAGIRGRISTNALGNYTYSKWGGICNVKVFPMEVDTELDNWLEKKVRTRSWFAIEKAIEMTNNYQITDLFKILYKRVLGRDYV